MTETPKLMLEKDGPIGWIIFNQPQKRNAVSLEMWQLMPDYVRDLATDDAIRVVILRGAGDQAFVAGADISQFKERRRNMADQEEYSRISARGQDALTTLSKPLLAMIHGYCVGGGVGIAITCDLRIAADDARFGIPAARLGLGYHYRGMEKLMQLVGPAYTKEIFFTARTDFSAQDEGGAGTLHPRLRADDRAERAPHAALGQGDRRTACASGGPARSRLAGQAHRRLLQQPGLSGGRQGLLREAPSPVPRALSGPPARQPGPPGRRCARGCRPLCKSLGTRRPSSPPTSRHAIGFVGTCFARLRHWRTITTNALVPDRHDARPARGLRARQVSPGPEAALRHPQHHGAAAARRGAGPAPAAQETCWGGEPK